MHFDTLDPADSSVRKAQRFPPRTIATAQDLHGSLVPSTPQASESRMAAKAKARCVSPRFTHNKHDDERLKKNSIMIVRLISTAQTGFFYTTQRLRTGPKLAAVKYDPRGVCARALCVRVG